MSIANGGTGNTTGAAVSASTATTAEKLGSSTVGSSIKPIYLNSGIATASTSTVGNSSVPVYLSSGTITQGSTYAGGTRVTLNGTTRASSNATFYAPTSAGTSGYILKSAGSGAPTWLSTLPIANGGTGATTAAAALANLGGVSITKLWENESPTSSFSGQTIELDLSEYQLILLYARISTSYESLNSASAVVGKYSRINGVWGNNNNVFHRAFTPSVTGIVFEGGYYNGAYNASYLIPQYIYGIKGVT